VFDAAQANRLEACARVLDPPARIVMTGSVPAEALAAIRRGARPDVELLVVDADDVATVEGSIDLLFFAAAPLTAALLRAVGSSRAWRYYGREGALAEYVRADLTHGERVLDTLAQLAQLAYFVRRQARRRLRSA